MADVLNAMTIDVEDYFHVAAFADIVAADQWPSFESRVCQNTDRILEMLGEAGVQAPFFVVFV